MTTEPPDVSISRVFDAPRALVYRAFTAPEQVAAWWGPTGSVRPLDEMENEIIRFAISHYRGQMSEVARRLKIGRSTLYRKLDEAAANDPAEGGAQDAN